MPDSRSETVVDHEVVDERIDRSIRGDADTYRNEDRQVRIVEAEGERADHGTGEHHRIEVVQFESARFDASSVQVVAAVEVHSDSVHDPTVQRVRDRLHRYEGKDRDECEAHGAYGSRCRAEC